MTNDDTSSLNANVVTCKVQGNRIKSAKKPELKKKTKTFCQFDAYKEVKNDVQSILSTGWVITNTEGKVTLVEEGLKRRIVSRNSPTVGKGAMHLVILQHHA